MMLELTREEALVIGKLRELGPWATLTVVRQNGRIESIEKSEREKIPVQPIDKQVRMV